MYHAFGQIVYLMTKECTRWVEDRENWNNRAVLTQAVIIELRFWLRNLDVVSPMPLVPKIARNMTIVYSDASATGCGALVLHNLALNMVYHWQLHERERSSTWREIKAIVIFLNLHNNFSQEILSNGTQTIRVLRQLL